MKKNIIKYYLFCWLTIPHIFFFITSKNRNKIIADIRHWLIASNSNKIIVKSSNLQENKIALVKGLSYLLISYPEFRTLFYYRIGVKKYFCYYLRPHVLLFIRQESEIGGGLYIQHGDATRIGPQKIGSNCWINQNVTIGSSGSKTRGSVGRPTIGNNVHICTGAIIVGDIKIGDNVVIGAGAVVTKDVPSNTVIIPSPAYILRENGIKIYRKL